MKENCQNCSDFNDMDVVDEVEKQREDGFNYKKLAEGKSGDS